MNIKGALHWAGEHPIPTTIGVIGGGLLILWLLGAFKGGGSSSSSSALGAAYYNAVGAQTSSANNLMATQNTNAANVAVAQIAGKTQTDVQTSWAAVSARQADDALAAALGQIDLGKAQTASGQTIQLAQIGATRDVNLAGISAGVTTAGIQALASEHNSDNSLALGKYQADTSLLTNVINGPWTTVLNSTQNDVGGAHGFTTFSTAGGQFVGFNAGGGIVQSAGDLAAKGFSPAQISQITGT